MKSPRPFTLKDNPAYRGFTAEECSRLLDSGMPSVVKRDAMLQIVNALNDMVSSLAGFEHCQYLPGDMIACKLNLVKMKKPRRNPWFKGNKK